MKHLILSMALLSVIACGKQNPYTKKETGNYFYCKIDGVDYYPEQDPQWNSNKALLCKLIDSGRVFSIATYNLKDQDISIGIWDSNKINSKTYILSDNKSYNSSGTYDDTPLGSGQYDTDSVHLGNLEITKLDFGNNLAEGKFSFKCYNSLTQKTANVTDGEFSLYFNK